MGETANRENRRHDGRENAGAHWQSSSWRHHSEGAQSGAWLRRAKPGPGGKRRKPRGLRHDVSSGGGAGGRIATSRREPC